MLKEIKRYQIRSHLGKGSMADVYEAYDPHTDRTLAIKILREDRQENNEYLQRFFREAKAVGSLSHSSIVAIYDIDEFDKRPFIVMEHLKGIPLSELIRSGRKFSFDEIVTIGMQLGMALDYAHSRGIIHRDIKPSNIIITSSNFKVKITDFGIAHFEDPEITMKTRVGDVLGTPQYMSPEQIQGTIVDGRSDLFSVGVILYQLLTGERPFSADTIPTLMYRITTMEPKPMNLGPEVPKAMRYIVNKLLEKKPESRYQSGKELAAALKQAQLKRHKEPRKLQPVSEAGEKHKPRKSVLKTFGIAASAVIITLGALFAGNRLINTAPDPGRIYGMALSGDLQNSKIDIYKLNANTKNNSGDSPLEKIAEGRTNENGVFVAPLLIESQALMIVAQSPDGDHNLSSVVNYIEGQEIGANITLFSHIASALALHKLSQGEAPEKAIHEANSLLAEFLQIDDILASKVVEITPNSARNPSNNDKFSIIQTSLNQLLKKNNQSGSSLENIYSFANLVFEDVVFDGKLNGIGEKGSLHFGARAFSIKYFREGLANAIMEMGKSFDADFVMNDFYKIALLVNDNTSYLFDGDPSSQLKESPSAKLIAKQLNKIETIRKKFSKDDAEPSNSPPPKPTPAPAAAPIQAVSVQVKPSKPAAAVAAKDTAKQALAAETHLSGIVSLGGFVQDATIRVSTLTAKGASSHVLATTKTNPSGKFSLSFAPKGRNDVLLVAAYGGKYRELLTNKTVKINPGHLTVSAIVAPGRSTTSEINLTFFTHISSGLAQYLIKTGTSPKDALNVAHERIKNVVGFEFRNTIPATAFTENEHNGLITPELAYGMFNAAIANITLDLSHVNEIAPHTEFTSAAFAEVAYKDLYYDGKLNGVSADGGITFGTETVNTDMYRRNIAQSLLSVAQSNFNNTGLKFDQFFTIASGYNDSTDAIFANQPITLLSSEGPLITRLNPGKESTLTGEVEVSASVNDVTGIQRATFWLGKTFLGNAKNPLSPSLSFNSRRFPSGAHRLKINVLNKEGKESTVTHYVYVNNKVKKGSSLTNAQNSAAK
ncbi:MAG: serine/threonine-protein kinase [Gammaproteobacteria bacterium]|jgi:serine/threonine protein kinase